MLGTGIRETEVWRSDGIRTLKLLLSSRRAASGLVDVVAAETDNAGAENGEHARLRHFGCCGGGIKV